MTLHALLSRCLLPCAALLTVGTASTHAAAAESVAGFPDKPVRIVVPFPPGGAADTFGRVLADKLGATWKQPVLVENKPGAGGRIATEYVAKVPADGHTLLLVTVGHAVNPSLYQKLRYDTERDFTPVAMVATLPSVLAVHPAVQARSVTELVALARRAGGKMTYASSGSGSTSHIGGAQFASLADVALTHVPYKGAAPALTDLVGGQVDMMIDPVVSSVGYIKSGKLRALAVTTPRRSPLLPDVPTMAEAGLPAYQFAPWFMMIAPSGVSREIVQKLNHDIAAVLASADVRSRFEALGAEPATGSPPEAAAFLRGELDRYAKLVRSGKLQAE